MSNDSCRLGYDVARLAARRTRRHVIMSVSAADDTPEASEDAEQIGEHYSDQRCSDSKMFTLNQSAQQIKSNQSIFLCHKFSKQYNNS